MSATRLVLARHGQTVWHHENRYAGVSDVDLSELGHRQADSLARWATRTRPDCVVSSPVRRALETANPVARALGQEALVVAGLREVAFGVAEGRTIEEMRAGDPAMVERFRSDPVRHHFPDGEDPADAAERVSRSLRDLARAARGSTVLVVAHSTALRLGLCRLLGIDVRRYRSVFPRLDNGTLTELAIDPDVPDHAALLSFNVPLVPTLDPHPTP